MNLSGDESLFRNFSADAGVRKEPITEGGDPVDLKSLGVGGGVGFGVARLYTLIVSDYRGRKSPRLVPGGS